jgi:arabinogalactan endo-1,4-beta-galactosidase
MLARLVFATLFTAILIVQSQCFEKIIDFSSLLVLPNQKFTDVDGTEAPLEQIFANNGMTMSRQRLWAGQNAYDLKANVYLARRAQAAGMKIYLNVFMRDTWTDPAHIQCYDPWGSTMESISRGIYEYCHLIGDTFAKEGIVPEIISLGNELSAGVCSIGNMSLPHGPENTAIFLQSASNGIRDSLLGKKPKLLIHVENGWDWDLSSSFFDRVFRTHHLDPGSFDLIGLTAYPFYNGKSSSQGSFARSIQQLKKRYQKGVMIVESAWPSQCTNPPPLPSDAADIPFSSRGQIEWIGMMTNTAKKAGALSMAWWEASWLTNAGTGSPCERTLLFDETGRALPSLSAFKRL